MPTTTSSRARRWCFTINNYCVNDVLRLRDLGRNSGTKYLVFGREGRTPGKTPHLQGYIEFTNGKTLTATKRVIGECHLERANGSAESSKEYCTKEGDHESYGSCPRTPSKRKPGRRTDLEEIKSAIDGGASELEVFQSHFSQSCQYRRSFNRYRELLASKRQRVDAVSVFVLIGSAGVGKTRYVVESEEDLWMAPDAEFKWFDGYNGQRAVLFDDFRGEAPIGQFLRVCDRYSIDVPVKGGFVPWRPERIYFTSNVHPSEWYTTENERTRQAVARRISCTFAISNEMGSVNWDELKLSIATAFGQ